MEGQSQKEMMSGVIFDFSIFSLNMQLTYAPKIVFILDCLGLYFLNWFFSYYNSLSSRFQVAKKQLMFLGPILSSIIFEYLAIFKAVLTISDALFFLTSMIMVIQSIGFLAKVEISSIIFCGLLVSMIRGMQTCLTKPLTNDQIPF